MISVFFKVITKFFFLSKIELNFSLFNTEENKSLIITRLPVTRWVKLSLNFELLVPK